MESQKTTTSKFIVVDIKTHDGEHTKHCVFASHPDRMVFGIVQNQIVKWGWDPEDSNVRNFLDYESAMEYMRKLIYTQLGREDVDFLSETEYLDAPTPEYGQQQQRSRVYRPQ